MAPKLLVIITSHSAMGNSGKQTGWFLPELAHPFYELEGKVDIIVASPKGGEAPLDHTSVEMFKEDAASTRFLKEQSSLWKETSTLEEWVGKTDEFDGIFYVGGHGPMFDLVDNAPSQALIKDFWEKDKIVSAVCHGPAAFINVKLSDGSWLVDGKELTALSDAEEESFGTAPLMPFKLETSLRDHGENPASAAAVGKALVSAL